VALDSQASNYTGTAVLETLSEAQNYNRSLGRLILKFHRPTSVLDFGAGIGTFAKLVEKNVGAGNITCVEPDESQRKQLEQTGFETHQSLGTCPKAFDFIYSLNVLEHIKNDSEAASNLAGRLNPGGTIFIFVPAFQILYSNFDKMVGHHRRYTKNQVLALFPDLEIIECRYWDSLGFLAAFVYKILSNRPGGSVSPTAVMIFDRFIFPLNSFLDPLFSRWFGKNVMFVGRKRSST
jgi:cyclopropane fatty-acyl-phospholipid synthase-like methyltransferase